MAAVAAPAAAPEPTVAAACTPPLIAEPTAEARKPATMTVATAHVMKPCAVSRKNTSCVWVLAHLVLRRPARYPPTPDDSHCTTMNHAAVIHATPVADAPLSRQGETDARPRPDPRATSTIDAAAATDAPPKMAGQVTAEMEDSGVA